MSSPRLATAAITLLFVVLPDLAASTAATAPTILPPTQTEKISVQGATAAQSVAIGHAISVYTSRGLELPSMIIRVHSDEAGCGQHGGIFRYSGSDLRIDLCSNLPRVVLHELGHAWTHLNMTAADRRSYTRARGLPTWNDWSYAWKERAAEDAAFVLQQNLMAKRPVRATDRWHELISAYETLTRKHSPVRLY